MISSRDSKVTVKAMISEVSVQHHPDGALRNMPEHYRVIAGPGAADIKPDALDELISDLVALRSLVRS